MDPDPAIFVTDLQDANKNLIKINISVQVLKVHLHYFFTDKKSKKSLNSRNHGVIIFA
jgi:hypothetical protein